MELYKENGTVILRREGKKPDAVRIIKKSPLQGTSRDFSVSPKSHTVINKKEHNFYNTTDVSSRVDLTNKEFFVTRAREHARAYARENSRVEVRKENPGLKRVLDAALSGSDVKVASIEPMSLSSRLIAFLLIPILLISPVLPAYANEAPLAERIASDVAAVLDSAPEVIVAENTSSSDSGLSLIPEIGETSETLTASEDNNSTQEPLLSLDKSLAGESNSQDIAENISSEDVISNPEQNSSDTVSNTSDNTGEVAGESTSDGGSTLTPADSRAENNQTTSDVEGQLLSDSENQDSAPGVDVQPSEDSLVQNSTSSEMLVSDETDSNLTQEEAQTDETQIIDIPPVEVQEDLQTIKAKLREEIKDQVRNELKREVEREVYNGCKNLDGFGYYCVPDAKSFGSVIVENDRKISVSVQSDPAEGDKEIYLERDSVAIQLTHNSDDDAFPVLDPTSDLLVWQSLVNGHWQIAYAYVDDVGVPKVNYLTNGENNFNPKVYRERIVWQAWVDGNWEIFTVVKSQEKIEEDSLTAEHRAAKVDGSWKIKRITANNVPDMFPSITTDNITWQSIDDGVWQVFSYDLLDGKTKRISKKGVRSESPRMALIWSEEDETGQIRLVGSDINNSEYLDFTSLARRIVDRSREEPKTPISNTEIIVEKPTTVRAEDEVVLVE